MSLEQRGRVSAIGLVAQNVAAHVLGRQQQNPVAQALQLPGPMVRGAASLQQHSRRWTLGEETRHLAAREALPLSDAPGLERYGHFENVLGQIHGDSRRMIHGLLLSVVA